MDRPIKPIFQGLGSVSVLRWNLLRRAQWIDLVYVFGDSPQTETSSSSWARLSRSHLMTEKKSSIRNNAFLNNEVTEETIKKLGNE
jgi:hypothetical protein